MSRSAKALMVNSLPPLVHQVEVMVSAGKLEHHNVQNPAEAQEESHLTVLVLFEPTDTNRWLARSLAASLYAAHTVFEQCQAAPEALHTWLTGVVLQHSQSHSITLALSLPTVSSPDLDQQIVKFLKAVRGADQHHLRLVIGVADKPADWAHCTGVDSFVACTPRSKGQVALSVFRMLTMFMASDLIPCVDTEDLRLTLGSAAQPSTLWEGAWLTTDARLVLPEAAFIALRDCQGAYFASTQLLTLQSQRQLTAACVQCVPPTAEVLSSMCGGLYADQLSWTNRIVPVLALCKPAQDK